MTPIDSINPTYELSLQYGACGCRESWATYNEPEEATMRTDAVCLPDCADCLSHGRPCPTRAGMPPAYVPIDFEDVHPIRKRYVRMKAKA